MPRILFCLDYYYPHQGGAEVLFKNLTSGLVKSGWDVDVLTQRVAGTSEHEVVDGVNVTRVSSFGQRYLFSLSVIPKLVKLARKADIIHATTFASTLPAWLVSKLFRKRLVLTVHEVWIGKWNEVCDDRFWRNWLNDKLERFIYFFDYGNYIAVSHATARDLMRIGVPEDKVKVIYNGVNYQLWRPENFDGRAERGSLGLGHDYVFFFSGRPGRSKGLEYLLLAMAELVKSFPNVKLLAIVGNSQSVMPRRIVIAKMIRELGLNRNVILHDPVRYKLLPGYVVCSDTVVVPSLSEGFGFTAAEACAMKKPVIVMDNASLPEVVSGKYILVPPRDVKALVNAMEQAIKGKFKYRDERKFLVEENVSGHLEYYKSLLNNGK